MAETNIKDSNSVIPTHESNIAWLKFLSALCDVANDVGGLRQGSPAIAEIRQQMDDLLAPHANIHGRTNEDRVCAIFDWLIQSESGINGIQNDVVAIHREFRTGAGFVDRLLVHADGTVTVVEIKGPGSRRDHACGLGQALVYAAAVREEMPKFHEVRSALFVGGEHDQWLSSACRVSGVAYECIGHKANKMIVEFAAAAYEVMRGNRE